MEDEDRRNNEIGERIAYLKQELEDHPEEAYMVQVTSDTVPKEEITALEKEIEETNKLKQSVAFSSIAHTNALKDQVKKLKGLVGWKNTELQKLDKKLRNTEGEEKRIQMSEDVMSNISAPKITNLKDVFNQFSFGFKEIDGKIFAKLAVDCKIVNKKCSKTDIDLIFAKVKEKSERKITFPQFKKALELCAEKRGEPMDDLEAKIIASGGKTLHGTKAQANKFHDDKDLYTGVHGKGGPSTLDTDKIADIGNLLDRTEADVRGRRLEKGEE